MKPTRQASLRLGQLPVNARHTIVPSCCSANPQSTSSLTARSIAPVPRIPGCEPNAISARPVSSLRSETVPPNRPAASTANPHSDPSAQPWGIVSPTNSSAIARS